MKEFLTTESLFTAMKNPSHKDLDDIAVNLIRNFCIIKNEADGFGVRQVRYNIVELEIYFYNNENDDWPTYNRDCVAGQWFFHRSGVDIAFQTQHDDKVLTQFGGVLIRGLERIVDGRVDGYIGGPQRCMFNMFNAMVEMPKIYPSEPLDDIVVFKNNRVRISLDLETGCKFRYFREVNKGAWEYPQMSIYTAKKGDTYSVYKDYKVIKYSDAPCCGMGEIQVYPNANTEEIVFFSRHITAYKCWNDIEAALKGNDISYELLDDTKDIWVRDFMPIQKADGSFVSYVYNPDYLRDEQKYITRDVRKCYDFSNKIFNNIDITIDGGNVILCGDKVIMTDKVFCENKHKSEEEIKQTIETALECKLIIIPWDKEEKYGHADGMVRYVGPGHVLINNYADFDELLRKKLLNALSPHFEKISELKYHSFAGEKSWAHINFLRIGGYILVPQMGIASDRVAVEQLSAIYSDYKIIPVRADGIVSKEGALNCVSWNIISNKN